MNLDLTMLMTLMHKNRAVDDLVFELSIILLISERLLGEGVNTINYKDQIHLRGQHYKDEVYLEFRIRLNSNLVKISKMFV